jgi:hypothetical protein
MTLRPFKTIRQYKQLVGLLNQQIEQLKQIDQLHQEHIAVLTQRLEQETKLTSLWKGIADQLKKQESEPLKMPLPDVGAVEGLVSAFFENESITVAQHAHEITRHLKPMEDADVKATNRCLMKLWKFYSWRKIEAASKQT